nr:rhodanese-related sulfurtransferase [Oceanococcus sp. HetDA_MAG_MS8]
MPAVHILALYQFAELPGFADLQEPLRSLCEEQELQGTLLLAAEGINGTVAGSRPGLEALLGYLSDELGLNQISVKWSTAESMPFLRMKVRLKNEIVTMGVPGTDPLALNGRRVRGPEWNALLDDPEVLVIDTRNDYEIDVGTFPGAISPHTEHFREFPSFVKDHLDPQKHRKVAMFCTGGIRCEKATHHLLKSGFAEVYHLDGGILQYFEDMPREDNRWEGECFVFDGRVSVDKELRPGSYTQCHACRHPLSPAERNDRRFEAGVSCPHCADRIDEDKKARLAERERQMQLAEARQQRHLGQKIQRQS